MGTSFEAGRMIVGFAFNGKARFLAVVVPGPASELASRHTLEAGATKRAAEGLVVAVLLSAHIKGDERLTLDIQSTSPPFSFVADVNGDGSIRGRFRPADVRDQDRFFGMVSATKSLFREELYRGISQVEGETMEQALQRFLRDSQQVDSYVRVGVALGDAGEVEVATGLLVERLPNCDPDAFSAFVAGLRSLELEAMNEGLAFGQLGGEPIELLGTVDLPFRCGCSADRVRATLRSLGRDELAAMIAEQAGAEVTCHFCNEAYRFDAAALEAIRETIGEG